MTSRQPRAHACMVLGAPRLRVLDGVWGVEGHSSLAIHACEVSRIVDLTSECVGHRAARGP